MWRYPSLTIPGNPSRTMVDSRRAGQQGFERPELLVVGKGLLRTPVSDNAVDIRTPLRRSTAFTLAPPRPAPFVPKLKRPMPIIPTPRGTMSLQTSMPSMTQVPLGGATCSTVPLQATTGKTWLQSDLQEQPCWSVRQVPLQPRPPISGTCARRARQVSNQRVPRITSLSPVAPGNLGIENPDSRTQLAEDTCIHMTSHLPTLNVLEAEKPGKATMEAAKKTVTAMESWEGVRTPRLVLLKDEAPVSLANQTTKIESQQKDCIETHRKRREEAPKHVRLSQIRGKGMMRSQVLDRLEERGVYSTSSSMSKIKVENTRQVERRRAPYLVSTQNQDSEVNMNQRPESQSVHMDLYNKSSFPNILPNLRPQQKEEEGYPEVLVQGKPLLQPRPPKTPKSTSMGTKSKTTPQ